MSDKSGELKRLRRLLRELADLSEHSSLTGSLSGGARNAVRRYNAIVRHMEENDLLPEDLFHELDEEESGFDQLGVECKMLLGYLEENGEEGGGRGGEAGEKCDMGIVVGLAPFMDRKDLRKLVRAQLSRGARIDEGLIIALAPFLEKDDIGRIIREHLPQWFQGEEEGEEENLRAAPVTAPAPPSPPAPVAPPAPPAPPEPVKAPAPPPPADLSPIDRREAEIAVSLQVIADQLKRADLTEQDRNELSAMLAKLAQEQAEIAARRARGAAE